MKDSRNSEDEAKALDIVMSGEVIRMAKNIDGLGTQWQSPEHVAAWFADKERQADHERLRSKLVKLLPFDPETSISVLDIGAGDGALSLGVLARYPKAQLVCHDFSDTMLSRARERLAQFREQVIFVKSDLREPAWTHSIRGTFDAVVSSVAIHNVAEHTRLADPSRIREIYAEVFGLVKPGGCFLNYDHVYPPGPAVERIYEKERSNTWRAGPGTESAMEKRIQKLEQELAQQARNQGNPSAKGSESRPAGVRGVLNHLEWLQQAGFDEVDCLWKEMHTAIIGGFRY